MGLGDNQDSGAAGHTPGGPGVFPLEIGEEWATR